METAIEWLLHFDRILIVIHQSPDGDAIASSLALYRALIKLGKSVAIVSKDSVPRPFLFLPDVDKIQQDFFQGDWQVIVVLDCGDLKRTGIPIRIKDLLGAANG